MLLTLLILLIALVLLFFFYLWAIHPNSSRRTECLNYGKWDFAHRGLWDMSEGIPENSLPAFQRAAEKGFAIELDIHLTADGELAVFHDDTLARMCGRDEVIESLTYKELTDLRLLDTDYGIPRLSEVLALVKGRVPLLIELKLPSRDLRLCSRLLEDLKEYKGRYLIESFNPFGLHWFRKHCPHVLRGQLAARYTPSKGLDAALKFCSTTLLVNCLSRPDFISYNYKDATGLGFRLNQKLYRIPIFVWTVRSRLAYPTCKRNFGTVIFENFLPGSDG